MKILISPSCYIRLNSNIPTTVITSLTFRSIEYDKANLYMNGPISKRYFYNILQNKYIIKVKLVR